MSINKSVVVEIAATIPNKFDIFTAQNGNFRVQLERSEMSRLTDEEKMRAFIALADAVRAKGLVADFRLSFKGNDSTWVHYPSLWINQEARVRGVDPKTLQSVIDQAVKAALAAQGAKEETKPEENKKPEGEKPSEPVY